MDNKTRWLRTLRFQSVDHPPVLPPGPWPTTLRRWEAEGLPKGADLCEVFGVEPAPGSLHLLFRDWLSPPFEPPPIPTDIIHGEEDELIPLGVVADYAARHGIPLHVLPRAGHFFHGQLGELKQTLLGLCRRPP